MVYISRNGSVFRSQPWGLTRLIRLATDVIYFFIYFFTSLVGLNAPSHPYNSGSSVGSSRGSGGGGGGGGSGRGPWGPGGGGPSRKLMTMSDLNPPTIGGCPGGSCGR